MFSLWRIKWTRHGLQILLLGAVLAGAWLLNQTQGAAILELYALLSRPFQSESPLSLEAQLSNARSQELQAKIADLEKQNQQLKTLLGYVQEQQLGAILAPIIGRSPDNWWNQAILGRGSADGIAVGSVVTGIGGVVGRVVDVTPHTSRVLLVSDPSSRVGAMVARSRSMGLVQGKNSQRAVMQFLEKVPNARPGDMVTTSTFSRLFPAGLPIGRIKSVNLESSTAPEATLELTAPINHLEWVLVQPFKTQ
jgi:rod shape-determining protein MreC